MHNCFNYTHNVSYLKSAQVVGVTVTGKWFDIQHDWFKLQHNGMSIECSQCMWKVVKVWMYRVHRKWIRSLKKSEWCKKKLNNEIQLISTFDLKLVQTYMHLQKLKQCVHKCKMMTGLLVVNEKNILCLFVMCNGVPGHTGMLCMSLTVKFVL